MAVQETEFAALIDRLYEAAAMPGQWREALADCARTLGADGALLVPGPGSALAPHCSPSLDEAVAVGVREGWFSQNPRLQRGLSVLRNPGAVVTEEHLFTPRELDHIPFNAEFVNRVGFRSFAAFSLVSEGRDSVYLSLERRGTREAYARHEVERIARLVPHLQGAGRLALRLAEARAAAGLEAFDLLRCGGVLLDGAGAVLRMNARARALMGDGLSLVQNALVAQHGAGNAALGRLIGGALRAQGPRGGIDPDHALPGPAALPRRSGPPLVVHALPLPGAAGDLFQRARAILLLMDPADGAAPGEALLRQAYGLTAAEARLAVALSDGRDLTEAAHGLGVAVSTARTQLKAVFAKTGTHRQAELAALLARLARGP